MAEQKDIVRGVVEILLDGHKGFSDFAEHIEDPQVKAFFVKESQTRAQFASELESAAGLQKEEDGTAAGTIHRTWGDLKANLGGGDHTLLDTAEQGEDAAKEAYEKALKENVLTVNVREMLQKQ